MKFAFVENRYKTLFWDKIAEELSTLGCVIVWFVQNPLFSPKVGKAFVAPFPRRSDLLAVKRNSCYRKLANSDRLINYFG